MAEKKNRKAYQKPQVKKIDLTPQEAVLAGCKSTPSPTGRIAGSNNCGTRDNFCSTVIAS
ncbi:MAG: hypothetical protein KJ893_07200 [Candidatus Omnitrophica bacterium]|nr:hypothetical protein [Candidatus Omnitrophota bacterium]MBU4479634.1 hypothetical protein [Candidatus Omnitrophota bacterium]